METTSPDSSRMRLPSAARASVTAAIIVLSLLAISLFAHHIIDTDLWWHLSTGRYIVENGTIPGVDIYSYTAGGNRWIDLHWLFQVAVYEVYRFGGSYGLSLFFILIFACSFLLLWFACPIRKNLAAAICLFWLAVMATSSRFLVRPEAFTYLMVALYVLILTGYERCRWKRPLFLLIPLQALWVNIQGLFILGLFLIFAFAAQPAFEAVLVSFRKREADGEGFKKIIPFIIVLFGSMAACLLNPYGLEGVLFPFTLFTRASGIENVFARSIAELQPPLSNYNLTLPLKFFAVFFGICGAIFALDYRKLKLSHVIIFVGMGYLALNARRNVPVFVLSILPLAVEHVSNFLVRLKETATDRYERWAGRMQTAVCLILTLVMLLQIRGTLSNRYYIADKRAERFGLGFDDWTIPEGAFAFVKEKGIPGPFFNNLDIGGLFIWELYPKEKVFIDPRLEVNSAEVFAEYQKAMFDPLAFSNLSKKYGFNAAVISHISQDALYLMPILYFSPDWALVYLDPIAAVFVRKTMENGIIIREYGIDVSRDRVEPLPPKGTMNSGNPAFVKHILREDASQPSTDIMARHRFNLGLVFLVMRQFERAHEEFVAGLKLTPASPEAHYNMGLTYEGTGQFEDAMAQYLQTIDLDPKHARAHANLGRLYDEQGLKDRAEEEYKQAVKYGGNDPIPLYNLGALSFERGDREAARSYWQRALEINPSFTPAKDALQMLER